MMRAGFFCGGGASALTQGAALGSCRRLPLTPLPPLPSGERGGKAGASPRHPAGGRADAVPQPLDALLGGESA